VLASIPSPSDNAIHLGPLQLRAYGLSIALGVLASVVIAQRRWARRGGDPADISGLAVWAVLAGVIGARAYHVATDWRRFEGRWLHAFAIWEGGLGIPGGLLAGVLVGVWLAKRRGLPVPTILDVVAPAIPVAQAIGRLGNWFNQEVFGRPTDLPWGLEIDPENRPSRYATETTFHPTFLYEGLWNLALAGALVLYERRRPGGRPGRLFALYVGGYALGRLWVEALRADPASQLFGIRINIWVSAIVFLAAVAWLIITRGRMPDESPDESPHAEGAAEDGDPADDVPVDDDHPDHRGADEGEQRAEGGGDGDEAAL
jgi:phosphatidylglycerol---prolipoprotein diacylglyceryl transferase